MERGSDTHGPRLDEELRRRTESVERGAPVESRAEEEREETAPGDDEPVTDQRLQSGRPEGADQVEARSDLARFLQPSAFPADREGLLASVAETNAPAEVIRALGSLPPSRVYDNVESVWEDVAGSPPEAEARR
jgi:hypothetical protein